MKKAKDEQSPAAKTKRPGIEESFRLLDELLERLEDEDTPLEESFELYEKGLKLIKGVESQIDKVEQKLQILGADDKEDKVGDEDNEDDEKGDGPDDRL